jgi:hypothetical protein
MEVTGHESSFISTKNLSQVYNHPPQGYRARNMRKRTPQAAAGIKDRQVKLQNEKCKV